MKYTICEECAMAHTYDDMPEDYHRYASVLQGMSETGHLAVDPDSAVEHSILRCEGCGDRSHGKRYTGDSGPDVIRVTAVCSDRRGVYDPYKPTPTETIESEHAVGWRDALKVARRMRDHYRGESHRWGEVYGPQYSVVLRRASDLTDLYRS